jgi:hypothetical protein
MTAEQRKARATKAVASRKDRQQKPGAVWYKIVLYPEGVTDEWKGMAHAMQVWKEMKNNTPPVLWTTSKEEARQAVREWEAKGRDCEIYEQSWSPHGTFQPVFKHEPQPDQKRIVEGLRALLKLAEEGPQETAHE